MHECSRPNLHLTGDVESREHLGELLTRLQRPHQVPVRDGSPLQEPAVPGQNDPPLDAGGGHDLVVRGCIPVRCVEPQHPQETGELSEVNIGCKTGLP